jgi:hypothetical protein
MQNLGDALGAFARAIGVAKHQAEDALYSERSARAAFSRRSLLAGGAALAGSRAFSFAKPPEVFTLPPGHLLWECHWQVLQPGQSIRGLFKATRESPVVVTCTFDGKEWRYIGHHDLKEA